MARAISINNLTISVHEKGKRSPLISNVNFEIEGGKFIGIIGASGCGKSTLLKALAGLIRPTSGRILFAGQNVRDLNEALPLAVGYLPQFGEFHEALTVGENLEIASSLRLPRKVSLKRRQAWMSHIVKLARLDALLDQEYRTLSGGQKRRTALAEELIGDPAFFLLDEVTSGLDAFSDREMMVWLRDLAHDLAKTIVLVTHATNNLHHCDAILFLNAGRQIYFGDYETLLDVHGVQSVAELFRIYQTQDVDLSALEEHREVSSVESHAISIRSLPPPGGFVQFPTLLARQVKLFWRDKGQVAIHIALILTFPVLVAVFATQGLPQVRSQTLALDSNLLKTLQEQLLHLSESFQAASLISGLAMFQVILLTLNGANNGAREIAKERHILGKELRAGLSPAAYVLVKFLQIALLSLVQSFWMAWFVKTVCGFPGNLLDQVTVLFATTLAMSTTCLAISAASPSPERASLLAIYLVGFQLPLSGAALALPEWLSNLCRPFIAAYWGWSGYLDTFLNTRYFDIVKQSTETRIASYGLSLTVLALHIVVPLIATVFLTTSAAKTDLE